MARRYQPYLPLYVQDFLTDEKLAYCSASATGVYIRIMCLMHKSDEYGKILLKQKFKQSVKHSENFAKQLLVQMPYDLLEITSAIDELLNEGVLYISEDYLIQKRMVKDCEISEKRSNAGSLGGKTTQKKSIKKKEKSKKIACDFALAKSEANTENEIEIEINNKGGVGENKSKEKKSEFERFNKWIDDNAPYIRKIKNQITFDEYCRIVEKYNGDQIRKVLIDLSNYKDAPKKYVSVNLTFQKWANNDLKFNKTNYQDAKQQQETSSVVDI